MVRAGKNLKYHLAGSALSWAGTSSTLSWILLPVFSPSTWMCVKAQEPVTFWSWSPAFKPEHTVCISSFKRACTSPGEQQGVAWGFSSISVHSPVYYFNLQGKKFTTDLQIADCSACSLKWISVHFLKDLPWEVNVLMHISSSSLGKSKGKKSPEGQRNVELEDIM